MTWESKLSCLHFISSVCHQLLCPIFYLSLSASFVGLKVVFSITVPQLSILPALERRWMDSLGLALSSLSGSLWVLPLPFGERPFFSCSTEDASQSSASERRGTKLSLTLSSLSHISLPTAPENVKLNSSLPPSSQLSLSMINVLLCYLGKENPLLLMSSAVALTRQTSFPRRQSSFAPAVLFKHLTTTARLRPLLLVGQELLGRKINSCPSVIKPVIYYTIISSALLGETPAPVLGVRQL